MQRLLRCFFVAIVCFCCLVVRAAEENRASNRFAKAMVTDRDDNPLEGAQVVRLHWVGHKEAGPPKVLTDANGEFEYPLDETFGQEGTSSYVVIYKAGYAVGALNLNYLPARARLWPKKPVALRIVDAQQNPIPDAMVTLQEVGFADEFLHSNVPEMLSEQTGVTSREDGWAILRSTRPEFLHSVTVKAEGYGSQSFATDFSDAKFSVLQLWDTATAQVKIMDGDGPANNWTVYATTSEILARGNRGGGWLDKNPLNGNLLPRGVLFTEQTDAKGMVVLNHALLRRPVNLMLLDTRRKWRGSGIVVAEDDPDKVITLKMPTSVEDSGKEYIGKVVDAETGAPIEGAQIDYQTLQFPPKSARAISGKDGRIATKIVPGQWRVSISEVPDGYCKSASSPDTIVIPKDGERRLPQVEIPRANMVEGSIKGIDLAIRRARWIHIAWSDQAGESGTIYGQFKPDGTFRIGIPRGAQADTYAIVAVGGGNDELVVESKDPLVLTGTAE